MKFTKKLALTITLFLSGTSARGLSLFTEVAKRSRRTGTVPGLVLPVFAMLCLLWAPPLFAGNLDSPGAPSSGSGMPTLKGVYDRLDTGADLSVSGSFAEPSSGPGATGVTLNNISSVLPQPDNTNGLAPSEAMSGKTFWGLKSGTWGVQTGSLATQTLLETSSAVDAGYYALTNLTTVDTDLATANIKSGVTIFGVTGTTNVVDTTSGTALAGEILSGKVAYVDGSGLTGTMADNGTVNITPTTTSQTIPAGYHNGSGTVAGDANLTSANLPVGLTLFGVTGTSYIYNSRWIDMEDGTVRDRTTGLEWQQTDDGITRNWYLASGILDSEANPLFERYCAELILPDVNDTLPFRLPTKNELYAIASGTEPVLSSSMRAFTGVKAGIYWSDTSYEADNAYAYFVNFGTGVVGTGGKSPFEYGFVRCVR